MLTRKVAAELAGRPKGYGEGDRLAPPGEVLPGPEDGPDSPETTEPRRLYACQTSENRTSQSQPTTGSPPGLYAHAGHTKSAAKKMLLTFSLLLLNFCQ
jgi:hypothetical protein